MQNKSNKTLGLVIIAIVVLGGLYAYKTKYAMSNSPLNLSAEVPNPVIQGQMGRLKIYEPRKSMPAGVFLQDLKRTASLQNLKGQWTLVNLWATWCPPCLRELPSLQALNDAFAGQGFRVIAISLDTLNTPDDLDGVITSRRLGSVARNWDHTGELFKLIASVPDSNALPISFIVDPNGKVFAQLNGEADWTSPDVIAFVESLLGRYSGPVTPDKGSNQTLPVSSGKASNKSATKP